MNGCGHCGFVGPLHQVARESVETDTEEIEDGRWHLSWTLWWMLYRCPACTEPTVARLWWSDEISDAEDRPQVIYPTKRDNAALPDAVRRSYDKALKVKKVDPGFYAVGIGRMLEAVCKDKGQRDGDLNNRLDALAQEGIVPGPLAEQAHQLRGLRNFGAHDAEVEVVEADVPVIEDFAEAILEFLYRAPAKLGALAASLDERKAKADSASRD